MNTYVGTLVLVVTTTHHLVHKSSCVKIIEEEEKTKDRVSKGCLYRSIYMLQHWNSECVIGGTTYIPHREAGRMVIRER